MRFLVVATYFRYCMTYRYNKTSLTSITPYWLLLELLPDNLIASTIPAIVQSSNASLLHLWLSPVLNLFLHQYPPLGGAGKGEGAGSGQEGGEGAKSQNVTKLKNSRCDKTKKFIM